MNVEILENPLEGIQVGATMRYLALDNEMISLKSFSNLEKIYTSPDSYISDWNEPGG